MSRIPHAKRDELSPEQQKIWDHIHAVRTGGGGPRTVSRGTVTTKGPPP